MFKTVSSAILISLMSLSSAQATCGGGDAAHPSHTCWYSVSDQTNKHGMVVLSNSSIERVQSALAKRASNLLAEFENVRHALRRADGQEIAFFISHKNVPQQNCNLYALKEDDSADLSQALDSLGAAPACRSLFIHIGRAVAAVSKDEDIAARNRLSAATIGAERVVFTLHVNRNLQSAYKANSISNVYLFDLYHGSDEGAMAEMLFIPARTIKVKQGESLLSIASTKTGDAMNWPVIWAMNRDQINDPNKLAVDMEIRVPAEVTGWTDVDVSDPGTAASAFYGDQNYSTIIKRVCTGAPQSKVSCALPTFGSHDQLLVMDNASSWYSPEGQF